MQEIINKQKCVFPKLKCLPLEPFEPQNRYKIIIVRNDAQDLVEVIESDVIDFDIVMQQLLKGNSVFLGPKIKGKNETGKKVRKEKGNNYFAHV